MKRTVRVTGSGVATAVPDVATVRFAVAAEAPDVSVALRRLAESVAAVGAALRAAAVADRDIQTTSLSVYPSYDPEGRNVVGYRAQHQVRADVRQLGELGGVISAAVEVGDNHVTIDSVGLGLADTETLESQAREAAVADARRRAAELAGHAGAQLGSVVAVAEVTSVGGQPRGFKLAADTGVMIEPGEQTVAVSVEVTFALD